MSHPLIHAENSAKRFGGKPEDYIAIHEWFDRTKDWYPEMSHRAISHHSQGIFECAKIFGESFINSEGKTVYTRYVGEQHVIEDLGFIPTAGDYLQCMNMDLWMMSRSRKIDKKAGKKYLDNLPASLTEDSAEEDVII